MKSKTMESSDMLLFLVLFLFLFTQNSNPDEGVNFAKDKQTWQSSTTENGVSSRAVDGYKNPHYDQNSCVKTGMQYEPWWTVGLEQEIFVTSVRITNRADCCWQNLANFNVRVGATITNNNDGKNNPQCGSTYSNNDGAGQTISISCVPPLLGRYVTVTITGASGILNFCEVEVCGYQRVGLTRW